MESHFTYFHPEVQFEQLTHVLKEYIVRDSRQVPASVFKNPGKYPGGRRPDIRVFVCIVCLQADLSAFNETQMKMHLQATTLGTPGRGVGPWAAVDNPCFVKRCANFPLTW